MPQPNFNVLYEWKIDAWIKHSNPIFYQTHTSGIGFEGNFVLNNLKGGK